MSNYDFIRFCESVISDMEWTNEKYLRFIEDYRKASVLWDVRNPDYKNNSKKRNVVAGLAQKYGVEEGALKKKIKNLRSAFHREHHRLSNKKSGSVDERKWFAYDSLRFILDVAGSCGGVKKEESSFTADEPLQHQETEEDLDFSDNANLIELPPLLPERRSPENNTLNPALVSKEEDEYDLFGRSMAMQLRKMPELTALELMQKMQLMVLNSRKQLSNRKIKTKQRLAKPVLNMPSTSNTNLNRPRSPSPDASSQSTSSPCYKFEVMSPTERDPTSGVCDDADRNFTYVTTIEHTENFPVNIDDIGEDCTGNVPIGSQREMKRKSSSIDPLEVKHSKLTDSSFKND